MHALEKKGKRPRKTNTTKGTLGKKGVTKPSEFLHGREAILPVGSITSRSSGNCRSLHSPPTPQKSSLDRKDQRPDQGDVGNRAYCPYIFYGTEWDKLFHNEKISKGFFGVNVLVTVLSKEERILQGLYDIIQWNRCSEDTIGTEERVP